MQKIYLTTNELAERLCVKSSTVRRSLCVNGHYLGLKPIKMPNRRLLWPESPVNKLIPSEMAS